MRSLIVVVLCVALTPLAAAEEEDLRRRVAEISRGFHGSEPSAAGRARAALVVLAPDRWLELLPPGPLRSVVSKAMNREEVLAMFARAGGDPERRVDRWISLAWAVSTREDATEILYAAGALEILAAKHPQVLTAIAENDLLDGRQDAALRLLSDPKTVLSAAGKFLGMNQPEGLRFVAQIVGGLQGIPAKARARLGLLEPDIGNSRDRRDLGPERIGALSRTAREDVDPALRLLAARLLAYSRDPAAFDAAVGALRDARSAGVQAREWESLGKFFFSSRSPSSVPLFAREALLTGHIYLGELRAESDPLWTEKVAGRLRRTVAESGDARFRGMLLRFLDQWAHRFVDRTYLRPRPAPSFLALLDDLGRGRGTDPVEYRGFARRMAGRIRARALRGNRAQVSWGAYRPAEDVASPVHAMIPRKGQIPEDCSEIVGGWIDTDPLHLFDPEVLKKLESLRTFERRRILEAYPAEVLRKLVAEPPSRFGVIRRESRGDDLTGRTNRRRLLAILADAPAHAGILLEIEGLSTWPPSNRFEAGRVLQGLEDRGRILPLLEDDAIAAGFFCQALLRPKADDLTRAASLVGGAESRPEALFLMADWMDEAMPELLGKRDDDDAWPDGGDPVSSELGVRLGSVLRTHPDPAVCWLAARILALSGTTADLRQILENGADLLVGTARAWHPFTDLAFRVDSDADLKALLDCLEDRSLPPGPRLELFIHLLEFRFPPSLREGLTASVRRWVLEGLPRLDGDLPERMLAALVEWAVDDDLEQAKEIYLEALEKLPVGGARLRLAWRSLSWECE